MKSCAILALAALFLFGASSFGAIIPLGANDFFTGNALSEPGRQIEGGEDFVSFDPATDVFFIDPAVFGVSGSPQFLADLIANVPPSGQNVIVIQDTPTPFAAGIAATQLAGQITDPGPGFFIYFNSGLDLPRLVFSTDLSDPTADLKILARLTNLGGQSGRDTLPTFTSGNFVFQAVPEPSTLLLSSAGLLLALAIRRTRHS